MKKVIAPFLLVLALLSCKRDLDPQLMKIYVDLTPPDAISWDSVNYAIIEYSYVSELKNEEIDNPDVFHHTINMDLKNEYLTLEPNQTVVFKKFNLIGLTGKTLYYAPYTGLTNGGSALMSLPFMTRTGEGIVNYAFTISRYRE